MIINLLLSLIREVIWIYCHLINSEKLNLENTDGLKDSTITLVGFGQKNVKTIGYFKTGNVIDVKIFFTHIYVVPKGVTNYQLIIGNELFMQAEWTINSDGIKIAETKEESNLNVTEYWKYWWRYKTRSYWNNKKL